jgi:hypothetical protein
LNNKLFKFLSIMFVIFLIVSTVPSTVNLTLQVVEAFGPAFKATEKIPVIKPSKDYLPANYTHVMNLIFRFKDLPKTYWRETGIATTLLKNDVIRAYAYNSHDKRLVIADLNLVTLEKRVRYRILQYYDIPGSGIEVNGSYHPPLYHFIDIRSQILASNDTINGLVLATSIKQVYKSVEFRYGNSRTWKGSGPIVITLLKGGSAETYMLDLGAIFKRSDITQPGVIDELPLRMNHYSSASIHDDKMAVAQTSLEWPSFRIGSSSWFDYVKGAPADKNAISEVRNFTGIVLASVNLRNMSIEKAAYLYSPGYNVTAQAIPTSDDGFIAILVGWNSAIIVKVGEDFKITWATRLDFQHPLINITGHPIPGRYQEAIRLAEAEDGYAVLLPLLERPVLVFLNHDGTVRWSAYINTTFNKGDSFQGAQLSASGSMIYVVWGIWNKITTHWNSWLTVFTAEGDIVKSYKDEENLYDRFFINKDLFGEVHGELGKTKTVLCRPDGYSTSRPGSYMDVAYILEDYETMEVGRTNPFRSSDTNEGMLGKAYDWNITKSDNSPWLKASYSYNNTYLAIMKGGILLKTGTSEKTGSIEVSATRIITVLEDTGTIEFIPSFYYPIAILPDRIDFGQVHVGEEKAVDVEMIWLVQSPETSEHIAYYSPYSDDPSFHLDKESFQNILRKEIPKPDIDVGKRIRFRIYFKPENPGVHTGRLIIQQLPTNLAPWYYHYYDWPRITLPVRGTGVPQNESIKIGSFPVKIGVSASAISAPPHVLAGSTYKEFIYLTNVGNAEMVFLEGIIVIPGSHVLGVKGADMVLAPPNETLEPFFVAVVKLKPLETRMISLTMELTPEMANLSSPIHIFLESMFKSGNHFPCGAFSTELAALPPILWQELLANYSKTPYLAVDDAVRLSEKYLYNELDKFFSSRSVDEAGNELYKLGLNNLVLYGYINYLVSRATILRDEYVYTSNGTAQIYPIKERNGTVRVPVTEIVSREGNLQITWTGYASHDNGDTVTLRLEGPSIKGTSQFASSDPSLIWYAREMFFSKETLWTSEQGLIGLGKGVLTAATFGLINFKATNDYQAVGHLIGEVAGTAEFVLAEPFIRGIPVVSAVPRFLDQAGEYVGNFFARALARQAGELGVLGRTIGPNAFRLGFLYKMEGPYKTLFGLERVMMNGEGANIYGTIVKWAFNEKFAEQGWYLGLGYVRDEVTPVGSKLIAKTWLHWYPRVGKIAVYWGGKYVDIYGATAYRLAMISGNALRITSNLLGPPPLSERLNLLNQLITQYGLMMTPWFLMWLSMSNIASMLGIVSYSGDPNYIELNPSPYLASIDQPLKVSVHFENLANSTAPAYNITVKIYIAGPVNASSIDVWDTSHPKAFDYYDTSVSDGFTVISIRFKNITLPPNKNPPEGEGWVTIKLRLRNDTKPGSHVKAYADVYFDYNPPVRTNATITIYDPDPPKLTINTTTSPGRLKTSVSCIDKVSGCVFSILRVLTDKGSPIAEIPLKPEMENTYEMNLKPGTYILTAIGYDNAGNIAWSNTTITVPAIPQNSTANITQNTTTTAVGKEAGIHAWEYLLIAIIILAAIGLIIVWRRKHV